MSLAIEAGCLAQALKNLKRLEAVEIPEDLEDWEELSEEERWKLEERLEAFTVGDERDVQWEIEKLDRLIRLAQEVEKAQVETKLQRQRELLTDEGFFQTKTKPALLVVDAAELVEVVRWLLGYHQAVLVTWRGRLEGIATWPDLMVNRARWS